jgi:integrase
MNMCLFRCPNSAVFWYDFRFRGQRHRGSTGNRDERLAERIERHKRRSLEEAFAGLQPIQRPKRLQEHYEDLLTKKRAKWTPKTFRTAAQSWAQLEPQFGRKFAHEVTSSDIAQFRDPKIEAGVSPFSINRNIALLRTLLRRAKVWDAIREDYSPLPVENQSGDALTPDEEERLVDAAQQSTSLCLRVVVVLAVSSGMRYTELRTLRWSQVNLDKGYLIAGIKSEAGRSRRILLPPRALAALRDWAMRFPNRSPKHFVFCHERYGMKNHLLSEHMSYNTDPERPMGSFNVAWRSARKKAKVNIRFHDLRHTVVTRLLEGKTPFSTVAKMMGWSPANTVLMISKYGHLLDDAQKKATNLLDGKENKKRGGKSSKKNTAKQRTAAPATGAGDSRQEEPAQSDAAAGDPSAKKGGSSEAA